MVENTIETMIPKKENTGKNGVFKKDRLDDLLLAAKTMPDKSETKENLTVGELMPKMWPAIHNLLGKNYNYRDIARWMISQGIGAAEDTLLSAVGEEVRRHGKGRGSKEQIKNTEEKEEKENKIQKVKNDQKNTKEKNNKNVDVAVKKDIQRSNENTESIQIDKTIEKESSLVPPLGSRFQNKNSPAFDEEV